MVAPESSENIQAPNDDSDSTKSRRVMFALLALIILVLVACACIAFSQLVEVPDVVGLSETEARDVLEEAGFTVGDSVVETVADADPGEVTAQDPEGGERAFTGTKVILTVASDDSGTADSGSRDDGEISSELDLTDGFAPSGTGSRDVPGVTGEAVNLGPVTPGVQNMTEAEALATLRNAGYRPVIGGYGPTTAGVLAGHVYYQNPPPGTRLARGSIITLWVSSGGPYDGFDGLPYPRPGH